MDRSERDTRLGKLLALLLRHHPERFALSLDERGYVEVDDLVAALRQGNPALTRDDLVRVVQHDGKRRFSFSDDGRQLRANQGHSLELAIEFERRVPPEYLYHGTVAKFIPAIAKQGLVRGRRHHVHLSSDSEQARSVGRRRGSPVVLIIDAVRFHDAGGVFFLSQNGVWLTEHVDPAFITFP